MRMLMKVSIPVEVGNDLARKGTLGHTIASILEDLQPESAYFAEEHGRRTGFIVVDIPEASHIPRVAEPFFLALGASVEMHPAMTLDDLQKATPHIERAAKIYGHPVEPAAR